MIDEIRSEPNTVMAPTGVPITGRLVHQIYKIQSDEDAKDLNAKFAKGTNITAVVGKYVFTADFEESKIAIQGKGKIK